MHGIPAQLVGHKKSMGLQSWNTTERINTYKKFKGHHFPLHKHKNLDKPKTTAFLRFVIQI